MKSLLITRDVLDPVAEEARRHFDVTLRQSGEGLTEAEAAAALGRYDAILPTLGDRFTAQAFADAGEIRAGMLANFGVGYNHIDVAAAEAHGLVVSNTPDVLTDATADIGMLLVLAVARRAGEGERLVRAGAWKGFGPRSMLGTDVSGKRIGIVGMGRIGQAVARRAHHGFGMEVRFFNRSRKAVDVPAMQVPTLGELMAGSDFVVVTVPGGPETEKLIGRAELAAMSPGAFLVNIARGEIVDEAALVAALEAGEIAGAGLDVYEAEPHVPAALRAMENVVLLPHLGSATVETRVAMGLMAVDNARAWAEGRQPPQRVRP